MRTSESGEGGEGGGGGDLIDDPTTCKAIARSVDSGILACARMLLGTRFVICNFTARTVWHRHCLSFVRNLHILYVFTKICASYFVNLRMERLDECRELSLLINSISTCYEVISRTDRVQWETVNLMWFMSGVAVLLAHTLLSVNGICLWNRESSIQAKAGHILCVRVKMVKNDAPHHFSALNNYSISYYP